MTIKLVKRKLERVIATALALVVVFGIGAMPAMALPVMEYDVYAIDEAVQVGSNVAAQVAAQYEAQRRIMEQRPNRASAGRDILTNTLRGAASMQGFEGAYTLDDPYGIIEIVVQFVTPPAVALRLLNEDSGVRGRTLQSYEQQALTAHTAFLSQLEGLTPDTPPGVMTSARVNFEIFSEHHSLFNGVFMRVPQYMVRQIATLPEVFAVMPNQRFYATPGGEIYGTINQDAEYEAYQILIYIETYYDETEEYEEDSYGPYTEDEYTYYYYDDELTAAYGMVMGLVPVPEHPDFMYESRKLFDIYYIHNNMGITGNGVRVAVLDTGIDHYHTEFERFLYAGLIRGQDFTGSPYGLMDIHGHGTHVAGTVIAMAPNVELWHYKVLGDEGWGYWDWMIAALEQAREDDIHIVNLSLGGDPGSFTIMDQAVNLLVSDGVVAVVSAGNSGSGLFTVTPPSLAGLAITVANGTAGGQMQDHFGDTVSWDSSRGPMMETFHIKPDITAPGTA
ncbi:MAG: S8 family serine peptidase, partial [Oscillospiraceae bacterium]|nr:S8 family serine peptidase [Oscillospiraceae bacterium]